MSSSPPRRSSASKPSQAQERYVIPNLRNACRILRVLGQQRAPRKASELARELDVPVTTTLRIMATLCLEGFARKMDGGFELGPMLIQLGHASLAGTPIGELARPFLRKLTAATDETSHLAIPCDDRALIVAVEDSPHPLRAASRPGFFAELHCSSTGKIFLAHGYHDRLSALCRPRALKARTPHTLTSLSAIEKETATIRKRGYSVDREEFHQGVRCLAAPVHTADGSVVAAIGITASAVRFPESKVVDFSKKVRAAAEELSSLLGHRASASSKR